MFEVTFLPIFERYLEIMPRDHSIVHFMNSQEREKEAIRQERELRQVEREAAYLGINSGSDNVALLSRKEPRYVVPFIFILPFNVNGKRYISTFTGDSLHKNIK